MPELVPEELARKSEYKLDQPAPIATVNELPAYDAIIFGTGTRSRQPSPIELEGARYQGRYVAQIAAKLRETC